MKEKIIINYINEIHSCDLVDMVKYSRVNKGYKYIFTNIDIYSKYAWSIPLKTKTIKEIKSCFQKIFKERKPSYIWSDQESELFKIYKINKSNVITYQLKDMNDQIIKGQFYEKELQLTLSLRMYHI